jgi:hypothetical protein
MRIAALIIAGAVAALATLTAPALAKDSGAQKSEEKATSCHAYEQAPDGSWHALPCEEVGASGQTQHKGAARSRDEESR